MAIWLIFTRFWLYTPSFCLPLQHSQRGNMFTTLYLAPRLYTIHACRTLEVSSQRYNIFNCPWNRSLSNSNGRPSWLWPVDYCFRQRGEYGNKRGTKMETKGFYFWIKENWKAGAEAAIWTLQKSSESTEMCSLCLCNSQIFVALQSYIYWVRSWPSASHFQAVLILSMSTQLLLLLPRTTAKCQKWSWAVADSYSVPGNSHCYS